LIGSCVYRKGADHERQLAKKLGEEGFVVIRAAGSGKNTPDLIAGCDGTTFMFECKYSTKEAFYIDKRQIGTQVVFAKKFGGDFFVAVKFKNIPWCFLRPEQLEDSGKNYKMTKYLLEKGRKLRQLLYRNLPESGSDGSGTGV